MAALGMMVFALPGETFTKIVSACSSSKGEEGVSMDYLACDRATGRVWVPAVNTGSVDVIDPPGDKVTPGLTDSAGGRILAISAAHVAR